VLTFVYVVVTNDMVTSMVASSKEESRPYVTVDFVFEPDHVVNLVISNVSRTAAGSISAKIEPDLIGLHGDNLSATLLSRKIASLPPGRALEIFVGISHDLLGNPSYPNEYQVTLDYVRLGTTEEYQDRYRLAFDWYPGLRFVRRRGLHEIAASVEKLQRELGEAVRQGALQVRVSPDDETPTPGEPRSVPVEFTTLDDPWVQLAPSKPAKDPTDETSKDPTLRKHQTDG
jgi:hypothetical protein